MKNGFTLIELIVVIVIIGIIAVIAIPKFVDISKEAEQSQMMAMKGSLESAQNLIETKIKLTPDAINNAQNRFTMDDGQVIRIRGKLPDGRWDNTFVHLVDFQDIDQVTSNNCNNAALKWCVRQRGQGWFNSRGYASLGTGRGFVIFPFGYNVNQDRCYVYYINQNNNANPATVAPSITGVDFSEC